MSQNLVWNYFTQHRRPVAECNLCNEWYHSDQVQNLEEHLTREHPEVIIEIRESIRRANLEMCFAFDVGDSEARCKYTDNCIVNIFNGIDYLEDHLCNHVRNDVRRELRNAERNPDGTASQLTAADDNASASTSNQPTNPILQATQILEELPWGNSDSLVWRYFKPIINPFAKCIICKSYYNDPTLKLFENHLLSCHTYTIDKMRCEIDEEIRRLDLSPYFKCETVIPRIKCNVENCIHFFNIFYGTKRLKYHLDTCHKSICTRISMPQNNTDIILEQAAEDTNEDIQLTVAEDNASASTSNQQTDPISQDTQNLEELPWGHPDNLVWRYFEPDGKPYAKCHICKKRIKGLSLKKLEQHFLYCHTNVIHEIQCEINEEIRCLDLSPYFKFHSIYQIGCNIDNCIHIINIFHGTKKLKHHLDTCHESICTRISTSKNNTDVMTEQVAKDSNEDIQLISAVDDASASEQPIDALRQDTEDHKEW
ncbi:uncharacterized protein LOC120358517 [Solenopsis invicta]|uniref:uncharacterized protein LOC120358517 n=1 Tax=Solenopsis invicta TaxID=13686 RepID=UPI00193CE9D6|nr:uncharacterized protein LOC120358517 [Solenopsis invicta]